MRSDRLQNRVAGSVFTLPVCAVVTVLVWWLPLGQYNLDYAIGLVLATLIAYVLLETNNRFQLIRVRSRMVASVWMLFAAATASIHVWHHGTIVALALAIAHFFLFYTFEERQPVKEDFHAGLFLGIATLFVPWMVVYLLLFILHQIAYLRSLTLRGFFATLLGGMLPAMVVMVPSVITNDFARFEDWYAMLTSYTYIVPENYLSLSLQQVLSFGLPFLLILLGGIHYLCTSYNDKIRVRMVLYIFVTDGLLLQIFIALQPQHLELLLPSMLVCGSPLIAHFFALTRSWFTNALFVFCLLCIITLGYVTLALPSTSLQSVMNQVGW